MNNIQTSNKMNSILKNILTLNNCSFEKYMHRVECFNGKTEQNTNCFITPVYTKRGEKILFLSKTIENNWYETIKGLDMTVMYLIKQFNYHPDEYKMILHTYFSSINLEQFYEIRIASENIITKMTIGELEKIIK